MDKDPKGSNGSDEKDNQKDNQNGNPDPNVVALQKKLTEKDKELKEAQRLLEETKKSSTGNENLEALTNQVKSLSDTISKMEMEKEREALSKSYPDILPELLIGRSVEEREIIVAKQRKLTADNFASRPSDHEPIYKDRESAQEEMERIKKDKTLSTDEKLRKIREVKLASENL